MKYEDVYARLSGKDRIGWNDLRISREYSRSKEVKERYPRNRPRTAKGL
jgi:hypothetical protein